MSGTTPKSRGFTLIELAVTLTVLGLLLAFSVPAFKNINQSYQLKSTAENMAGTLRVWRERAIAKGTEEGVHFHNLSGGYNWHFHENGNWINGGKFPNGITLYSWTAYPTFMKDGRVKNDAATSWPGYWVLQNQRGQRDTVSVLASGLILSQ